MRSGLSRATAGARLRAALDKGELQLRYEPVLTVRDGSLAAVRVVLQWNEIAVTTVLAQPPITSAPPASATFIAMVQGAVYDAVNSIDQTHRRYLLTRKFDQLASQDAAAAKHA